MSEEEAVAFLEEVKGLLCFNMYGKVQYVGMCNAIFCVQSGTQNFSNFIIKVLDKIKNDFLISNINGGMSYFYLFPLTEEGYKKRLAYIDDLIKNIKDYV